MHTKQEREREREGRWVWASGSSLQSTFISSFPSTQKPVGPNCTVLTPRQGFIQLTSPPSLPRHSSSTYTWICVQSTPDRPGPVSRSDKDITYIRKIDYERERDRGCRGSVTYALSRLEAPFNMPRQDNRLRSCAYRCRRTNPDDVDDDDAAAAAACKYHFQDPRVKKPVNLTKRTELNSPSSSFLYKNLEIFFNKS